MWRVDRLCDPDDTVYVHLTSAQLDTIWTEFNRVGFFGFPATLKPTVNPDGTEESISPRSVTRIEVMTRTMRHSVYWDGGVGPYSAHDQDLIAVVRGVELRLWATPQYTALPPRRCAAE
jgi:hypothetical protein